MNRHKDLSILIVNWNTRDLLEQCLQSVFAHPPQADFEVFVVDNASSDSSARLVGEHYPYVHLIGNLDNVGFARGYVYACLGGLAGTLVAGMLGDWFLPFVYNIGLAGFRASMLGWLFLGGLVAVEEMGRRGGGDKSS